MVHSAPFKVDLCASDFEGKNPTRVSCLCHCHVYYVLGASLLTYSSYKNQFLSIVGLVKNGTTATPPANGLDLGVTSPNLHTMNMIFQLQTQSLHEG